ncbi:MAG: DUF1643 domain-containing protein [Alphaproteobacteria bacterium]|nr:DUF1643 domain-containing protein [Alphaproteobacteria bacterium]
MPNYLSASAVISTCGSYRYLLRRTWDQTLPSYVLGMLNPSTADAEVDDPTITRSVRRAASLGHGSLVVWNIYAFRATDPAKLRQAHDPVGPDNARWIRTALMECSSGGGTAVVGWGGNAVDTKTVAAACAVAVELGVNLLCLGITKDGHPRHPLYVSYEAVLQPWRFAGG